MTSVNGISINASHPLDPAGLGLSPGDTAELTVVRGTSTQTIAITVGDGELIPVRPGYPPG